MRLTFHFLFLRKCIISTLSSLVCVCVPKRICRCSESAAIVDNLVLKGGGSTTFVLLVWTAVGKATLTCVK